MSNILKDFHVVHVFVLWSRKYGRYLFVTACPFLHVQSKIMALPETWLHLQEKHLKGIDRLKMMQFWNWHVWERLQAFMLPHFKLNTHPVIKVSVWKKDSLILMWYVKICSNLFIQPITVLSLSGSKQRVVCHHMEFFLMKFFIWRGLFHNDSVCAVYLPNASRCWRMSNGMYNCSPCGRDLTSMDEQENKWCLERYLHTQRHTLGILHGALR